MERRKFIKHTGALATVASIAGCSGGLTSKQAKKDDSAVLPHGSMPKRVLGKTGIEVSRLGFGSHMTKELVKDPKYRDRMIRAGFDAGINLFDVYDHTLSDTILGKKTIVEHKQFKPMGRSLKGIREKAVISLVTVKPTEQVQEEIDGALEAFMTDYIDLYRFYSIDDDRFKTMEKSKRDGKIRAVGFVSHDVASFTEALERYGDALDYVMLIYNFHHNKALLFKQHTDPSFSNDYTSLMPRIEKMNLGVIGMKPMGSDAMVWLGRSHGFFEGRDVELGPAMLRYVMQEESIDTTIPAMNTIDELAQNLSAAYNPALSDNERILLEEMSEFASSTQTAYLPDYYKWLEQWA